MSPSRDNKTTPSLLVCWNGTAFDLPSNWAAIVSLPLINVVVIFGNILVILTVSCSKRMRNTWSNVFIMSLAFSDLLLGFFVLPLSTLTQITDTWMYDDLLCRAWLTADVWLCTASIYNLLIISVDRFVAVTKPLSYKTVLTTGRVCFMISAAWLLSLIVGLPLIFIERLEIGDCQCSHMMNKPVYIICSSILSFYLPFVVISYFYFRIYKRVRMVKSALTNGFIEICATMTTRGQTALILSALNNGDNKSERSPLLTTSSVRPKVDGSESPPTATEPNGTTQPTVANLRNFRGNLRVHKGAYCASTETVTSTTRTTCSADGVTTARRGSRISALTMRSNNDHQVNNVQRPRSQTWEPQQQATDVKGGGRSAMAIRHVESYTYGANTSDVNKRRISVLGIRYCESSMAKYQKKLGLELRALKTVGIVTGCFLICWFGFCFLYAFHAFRIADVNISNMLISVAVWLGYTNSAFNPFIYAVCNKQYRNNFRNLWCRCGKRRKMRRSSSFSVTSQYRRPSCIIETSVA